jgi:hypothetical protein
MLFLQLQRLIQLLMVGIFLPLPIACAQPRNPLLPDALPNRVANSWPQDLPAIPTLNCDSEKAMRQWRQAYQTAHRAKQQQIRESLAMSGDAIAIAPGMAIQPIVDQSPPGTAFLLKAGIHRMQAIQPKAGMQFYGEIVDGDRRTILNGARVLDKFEPAGKLYARRNLPPTGQSHGEMQMGYDRGSYSQDLFINHLPLRHVSRKSDVKPGTWFYDYDQQTIFIADNPAGKTIELSTTDVAFAPIAASVTIANLIIEKYANPAQVAAIGGSYEIGVTRARDWRVQGSEVRWNHGVGLRVLDGGQAIGNYIHHNGQMGFAANGEGALLEYNEVTQNNFAKFDQGWEAGGSKFAYTKGLITRWNLVYDNDGPGLWTDIDNQNTEHLENVVYNNSSSGIFHEISFSATIRGNYVANNGRETTEWLYGANILISTSKDVVVQNNTIEVNPDYGNGIGVIWQNRGTQYSAERNQIMDNTLRYYGQSGRSGVATDVDTAQSIIFRSNQMDGNRYYLPQANVGDRYEWQNQPMQFDQLRQLGREIKGEETLCNA